MSTSQFPLHPESVPPRIAYSPGHRQWLDECRSRQRRKALLRSFMKTQLWLNVIKFLAIPTIAGIIVAWSVAYNMSPGIILTMRLKWMFFGASLLSCVAFGIYADLWTAKVKTRSDWILLVVLGALSGVIIAVTGIGISLIPN